MARTTVLTRTHRSRLRAAAAAVTLVAALGTGLAACGGDDGGSVRDEGGTSSSGSGSGSGSGSASK